MNKSSSDFSKKIIILGFDALSPQIIEPMMEQGKLPNFSRLKSQGSYAHLATTNPPQSPVAWSGFATGKNPGKHGIYDFIKREPDTYALSLSMSDILKEKPEKTIKAKCLWQYTSDEKIPTTIISHPVTFPPDKIYGRMLSGMGTPDILGTEGTFTFYTSEPLNRSNDYGGKVFHVQKSKTMNMDLIGPRVSKAGKKAENIKVPFKATFRDKNTITIEYQEETFNLSIGQWSGWKEVVFNLSLLKKSKGIVKFYLAETEPYFKLYISPINLDPRNPFFKISYPKSYSRELADNIGLYYTQGMPMHTWGVNEKRLPEKPFLDELNHVLRQRKAMFEFELNRFEKGLLFCYFEEIDIIQHMFWRYIDSKHPLFEENAPLEYREIIQEFYVKMDEVLGMAMDNIGKDDLLIVLSDHGVDTFRRAVHINSWLRKNGYLKLKDPNAASGAELLEDIDWSKTKAYAIGFGAIYINQKNREAHGIVASGKETELLKQKLSGELKNWYDEKYNQPIINNVYKNEEIFKGDYIDEAPDLYIGFNKGYRASWQTALGAVPERLIEDNLKKWSASHLFDPVLVPGVIFTNRVMTKERPSIYDITPTILKVIGKDKEQIQARDFDGEPLF